MSCSDSSSVANCNIDYQLPPTGKGAVDWAVGGVFCAFYSVIAYQTFIAFRRKATLRLPWLSLLSFTAFRCVGFLMRAWVDDNPIQPDWSLSRAKNWITMLTTSYSFIAAGTTFFLIFLAAILVSFRRTCQATQRYHDQSFKSTFHKHIELEGLASASSSSSQRPSDSLDTSELRTRKLEDRCMMVFRVFIIAVAALNIVGAIRQFDYYWLNYDQGLALRKVGGIIQLVVGALFILAHLYIYFHYGAPKPARPAFFLMLNVYPVYFITLVFNLLRVFQPLTDTINQDPNYTYYLQVLPDCYNLFFLLIFNFNRLLDYNAV